MVRAIKRILTVGLLAAIVVTPVLARAATASSTTDTLYRALNLTSNKQGEYSDNITAQCGDKLEFRARLNNTGTTALPTLLVGASLDGQKSTTHHSTVTVIIPTPVSTATSNRLSVTTNKAASLTYVKGSTQLLNADATLLSTLPDGITSGTPVSIGALAPGADQKHFVQFSATVDCQPATPPTPKPTPTPAPVTPKPTPTPPTAPVTQPAEGSAPLANTGPGDPLWLFIGVTVVAGLGHLFWRHRGVTGVKG